jgi:methanogenic corrinoid protein MtbC1
LVLGTVKNDIHDFGKDIVATVMSSNGLKVIDLGVNVEPRAFVDAIKESGATLVGMSCLLTTVFDDMKEAIRTIKDAGLRDQVTILVGGGPVDEATKEYVGADHYCRTAQDGVLAAKKALGVS